MNRKQLEQVFQRQQQAQQRFHAECADVVLEIARKFAETFRQGGKILLFGNGGSAADAQHVAAELVGRFTRERIALPAIALTTDTSIITALGNDYGYDSIFRRQVEALVKSGDLVVGISTSGNSPNVLRALEWAKANGIATIGITGKDGGAMPELCDVCFIAPADETARIQEIHIAAWHAICDLVEAEVAGE